MKTLLTPVSSDERHAHNEIAALLSIIPGLGHIYKGHYEAGLLWMFLGMPFAIFDRNHNEPGDRRDRTPVPSPLLGGTRMGCLQRKRPSPSPSNRRLAG